MKDINEGGPAFPQWDGHAITSEPMYLRGGMTLRDWFAAAALQGFCRSLTDPLRFSENVATLALLSYSMADAMIERRDNAP